MDYNSEAVVLRVVNFYGNLTSISVSLADPFMSYFILLIKVNIATVIILTKVVASLKRFNFGIF